MNPLQSGMFRISLPALGLMAVLFLLHFFYDPYDDVGPDLLQIRAWGDYRVSPWTVSGDSAEIREEGTLLTQVEGKTRGRIFCRIDGVKPGELFRLCGEARSEGIVPGKASWQVGRTSLMYFNEEGRLERWNYPNAAGVLSGTSGWEPFQLVSEVQGFAAYAKLSVINWGRHGRYEARNLSLIPVRVKHSGPFFFWGAVAALGGLGCFYCRKLSLAGRTWGWAVMLVAGTIFVGVLLPGKVVDGAPGVTATVMEKGARKVAKAVSAQKVVPALKPAPELRSQWVQKKNRVVGWVKRQSAHQWGHAGLFFLFGIACGLCFLSAGVPARLYTVHHQDALKVLGLIYGLFIFSIAAELIQVVAISRTPGYDDWFLNAYGATAGLLIFVLCHLGQHPARRLVHLLKK